MLVDSEQFGEEKRRLEEALAATQGRLSDLEEHCVSQQHI